MKIVTVIGARPQFVKAAVVSRALRLHGGFEEILVHTGQHYDQSLSGVFFEQLSMKKPDFLLGVGSGSHGSQTGRMLEAIEEVLQSTNPQLVIVLGDTNSTLAGALAASKLQIPIAHVEAGLRSFNRRMPEEINRVLTDHCADLLFAPSQIAVQNLMKEGISTDKIELVGDVMFDAVKLFGEHVDFQNTVQSCWQLKAGSYILATIHRAENTDDQKRLECIFSSLESIAAEREVIMPLHPRTRAAMSALNLKLEHINFIEPVGYFEMLALQAGAQVIVTDSGGVQKEAFYLEIPCVTLREETEWVELVDLGWNRIVPPGSPREIVEAVLASIGSSGRIGAPYGLGDAADRIASFLMRKWEASDGLRK